MDNEIIKMAEEKLAILYIISKSKNQININQLSNLVLEYDLFNYFQFTSYLRELIDSGFIDNSEENTIKLTNFSKETLDILQESIDGDLIKEIDKIFEPSEENQRNSFSTIREINGGYGVSLYVDEEIDSEFIIKYTIESIDLANQMTSFWDESRKELYYKLKEILKGSN